MHFIWKFSIIIYIIKSLYLGILPFSGGDGLGEALGFAMVEILSSINFIIITFILTLFTIIYMKSKNGYYYYFYKEHKQSQAILIMLICVLVEVVTSLLNLKQYGDSDVSMGYPIILANIIAILFIVTVGLSYIICKTDYMKKLEKQGFVEQEKEA